MKTNRKLVLLVFVVAGSLLVGSFNARADLEVSASVSISATADFEAPLSDCGSWVEVGTYGRCWRPTGVVVGWRPYCDGHWEWTDCGWYWVSDERWAWACYHYGNWIIEPGFGWIWVPGIEWGPAWVSWRSGGGYIGWAPLAPRHVSVVSANFVFVQDGRFSDRHRPTTVIVNDTTIINKTTIINNGVRREERAIGGARKSVVVNEGPGVAVVEKASGKKLAAKPIQEVDRQTSVPEQVTRGKGKPGGKQDVTTPSQPPQKSLPESAPKPKETPAPAPVPRKEQPQKPVVPDNKERFQPGKERDTDKDKLKPVAPAPERPAPKPVPEQPKAPPGADRQPGPGHPDGAGQPPPQHPQGPPAGSPPRPSEKGPDKGGPKGGHDKPDKHEKD